MFSAHEYASVIDGAMATKMTVQFNLFGGTVLRIGTKRHHDVLLKGIDSLEDIGCFGLTELGYGNNAVQVCGYVETSLFVGGHRIATIVAICAVRLVLIMLM